MSVLLMNIAVVRRLLKSYTLEDRVTSRQGQDCSTILFINHLLHWSDVLVSEITLHYLSCQVQYTVKTWYR